MQTDADSPFEVRVEPAGARFAALPTQTLREAAAAAGIVLPTACRNGTCRVCIVRLRSGRVDYRVAWPGLSAEERDAGWTLPCVALPRANLVIEQPAAILDVART
jgi:ferredoxin